MPFTFKKIERLCSKKAIETLFATGKSINDFPIKAVFKISDFDSPFPCRAMFVVPKKKHKRANKRNILKRRMREVYRLNKSDFYSEITTHKIDLMFIYLSNEELDYSAIETNIKQLMQKVKTAVSKV